MKTRTYKLYGTDSSSTNALSNVIIQRRGSITGVYWSSTFDCTTDNGVAKIELSFASVSQQNTNDTIGPISSISHFANVGAAGAMGGAINVHHGGMALEVVPGDRLYLNTVTASATHVTNCYVSVVES